MMSVGVTRVQLSRQHTKRRTPAALLTACHGDRDFKSALQAPARAAHMVGPSNASFQTAMHHC
eukprot:1239091-Amphidinium_carterae.1